MIKIKQEIYKDLIGVEFCYGGRTKEEGLDCLGLCYLMMKRLGIIIPEQVSVIDRHLRSTSLEIGKEMFTRIDKMEPGCIIGFRVCGILNHVAVALDDNRFIHCQNKKRVCIEKVNDLKWSKRVEGFYHLKERYNE